MANSVNVSDLISLMQALWPVILWPLSRMLTRLKAIEDAIHNNELNLAQNYVGKPDLEKLKDRVHVLSTNVQTLRAYQAIAPYMDKDKTV